MSAGSPRYLSIALSAAAAHAAVLLLAMHFEGAAWIPYFIGVAIIISGLPGMFAAMAFAGNVHAFSYVAIFIADFLFWFMIIYVLTRLLEKRKRKRQY